MKRRFRSLVLLVVLTTSSLSLAADHERVKEIGNKLMCICSCNQVLYGCNHINCPTSGGMRAELDKQIDSGKTDEQILAYFVEKYGMAVLSAPPASGFNLTAWVMPFVAFAIGMMMVIYFVRRFRSRWTAPVPVTGVDTAKYQQRVEDELKNYIPED